MDVDLLTGAMLAATNTCWDKKTQLWHCLWFWCRLWAQLFVGETLFLLAGGRQTTLQNVSSQIFGFASSNLLTLIQQQQSDLMLQVRFCVQVLGCVCRWFEWE